MEIYKTYKAGDKIEIKPEFQDDGDEKFEIVVVEDRGDRVLAEWQIGNMAVKPTENVPKHMIQE